MASKRVILGAFLFLVSLIFFIWGAFLIKQLFHSPLLDMRLVIANSYRTRAHGIIVNYDPSIIFARTIDLNASRDQMAQLKLGNIRD